MGAQRGDRDRPRGVRVVLVDLPAVEQPHPGSELGWHIQDTFSGGDQLLRQQLPEPPRSLDRPPPPRPAASPLEQPIDLSARCTHRNRPSCFSCTSSATAVCDPLCGSIPITTPATVPHLHAKISRQEEPRWARLNSEPEHASLEPHRGRDTTSWHLVRNPDQQVGRRFVRPPVAPHERYDRSRTPLTKFHSDGYRVGAASAFVTVSEE